MIRVGLVGLGTMGRNHLRVILGHPDAELVAVADHNLVVLRSVFAETGATMWESGHDLLLHGGLDAVVIASPTTTHHALVLRAIREGIPSLVEKPLAATAEEAIEIVAEAQRLSVPVQVGHVERFNPAVQELARCLGSAWLSAVYAIVSRRAGPFPARIRDVGVTIDLATHDVDILSWIAGERPCSVYAELARRKHATNEDLLFGLLRFPSGAKGMLDVNWLTPVKRRQLTVLGEEGMFELDYLTQRLTFTRANLATQRTIFGFASTFSGESVEIPVEKHEPLARQFASFVSSVRNKTRPTIDAEDGAWAVIGAAALLESALVDAPIRLPAVIGGLP